MWYMRQKEEFGEDRSQGIRFYDNTQPAITSRIGI